MSLSGMEPDGVAERGELVDVRVAHWRDRIRPHLTAATESIVAAGVEVAAALDDLGPSGRPLDDLCRTLGRSKPTLSKFATIGRNPTIRDHVADLPESWTTIYELAQIDPDDLRDAFEARSITPELDRAGAQQVRERYVEARRALEPAPEPLPLGVVSAADEAFARLRESCTHPDPMVAAIAERALAVAEKYPQDAEVQAKVVGAARWLYAQASSERHDAAIVELARERLRQLSFGTISAEEALDDVRIAINPGGFEAAKRRDELGLPLGAPVPTTLDDTSTPATDDASSRDVADDASSEVLDDASEIIDGVTKSPKSRRHRVSVSSTYGGQARELMRQDGGYRPGRTSGIVALCGAKMDELYPGPEHPDRELCPDCEEAEGASLAALTVTVEDLDELDERIEAAEDELEEAEHENDELADVVELRPTHDDEGGEQGEREAELDEDGPPTVDEALAAARARALDDRPPRRPPEPKRGPTRDELNDAVRSFVGSASSTLDLARSAPWEPWAGVAATPEALDVLRTLLADLRSEISRVEILTRPIN